MTEALTSLVIVLLVMAWLLPSVHRSRATAGITGSMSNLITLGAAHEAYAADWNGRQLTLVVDDLATYEGGVFGYQPATGQFHPPILLGWCDETLWGFYFSSLPTNATLLWPMSHTTRFGWFRMPNAKALHDYVNGRFYEPTYYAPNDAAVMDVVEPLFEDLCEFVPGIVSGAHPAWWSSYCLSSAALFNPLVLSSEYHWTDPLTIPDGFTVPSPAAARYPALKTQMIEHNWVQNPPARCNPEFSGGTYADCEPYFFNHGVASSPVTLFYDGHVRQLPNSEVLRADTVVRKKTGGIGLFFRAGQLPGASLLNSDGYYNGAAYDGVILNHHVLTVDGIFGRDTVSP